MSLKKLLQIARASTLITRNEIEVTMVSAFQINKLIKKMGASEEYVGVSGNDMVHKDYLLPDGRRFTVESQPWHFSIHSSDIDLIGYVHNVLGSNDDTAVS